MISQTPQLRDLLDVPVPIDGKDGAQPPVDNRYLALGCDLADIERLEKILNENIDIESCSILCVAEVSITYMDVGDADSLIRWASRYRDSIYDAPRYVFHRTRKLTCASSFLPVGTNHTKRRGTSLCSENDSAL